METYKGSWILPIGPRDGGQGRRHVSPVWWSSDESSYVPSGFDVRPADDFTSQDGIEDRTAQEEQPVQTKVFQPSPHPARIEHDKMSFANRLRRQPAANCLSAQYLESGGCSTHESREAGTVEKQTIRSPVATQDDRERTNHRARRSCQLPADMNQPKVVRISSGIRRVNAQTLAAMLEAGVWDDRDDSAVKENVHKANVRTSADTEDTHTRSSIASEATTATVWTGNVTANVGLQHFKAPSISPQHAEFLNVHSRSLRHESPIRSARRDLNTPRHRIEEQNNIGRLKSLMAKFDSKARAHVKARQRPRGQAVMRHEIASRQAPIDHGVRLTKVPNSRHRSEPLGPKELPRFANSTLLRLEDIPGYLLQRGHSTRESPRSQRQPPLATGSQDVRPSRGNFELGQARTVRFSKPGKASVVKISPHEPRPFDFGSLGLVETDLMFSAGAMAKSARRTNVQAAGTRPRTTQSSAIESATESTPPMQYRQRSRIPRAAPAMAEHAASPSKWPVRDSSTDMDRDVRFPQLLRRLTNDPMSNEDAHHGSVQELPRTVPSAAPACRQLNDRWTTGRIQSSFLKHNSGRLSLNEDARQSQIPNENDSTPTSPSKIAANSTPLPGHSGCPSLMSDDGQEPCDFPEAMANDDPRLPISPNVPAWEKEEDASTALNKTSSEGRSTLVHINMDENELFSAVDTEAIHDENIRADEIHAGVGTSNYDERGWLFWAPQGITSPISDHYHDGDNGPGAQRRSGRRVNGRRPDGPTMHGYCAILRWLISTSDAPGTPGMRNESTPGQELLDISGEYQLRLDDNDRAEMQRTLNRISDGIEPRPGSSDEVSAFIRSMNL